MSYHVTYRSYYCIEGLLDFFEKILEFARPARIRESLANEVSHLPPKKTKKDAKDHDASLTDRILSPRLIQQHNISSRLTLLIACHYLIIVIIINY